MGLTTLKVDVANVSAPKKSKTVEFIVDSGAIYPVVPSRTLKQLGIKPIAEQEFKLWDGSTIRRKKGIAMFRYEEYVGGADVIFGQKGDFYTFWCARARGPRPGARSAQARAAPAADDSRVIVLI